MNMEMIRRLKAEKLQKQTGVLQPLAGNNLGVVMRGCSLAECGVWHATGKIPVGADHPTSYSLAREFYSSEDAWKQAIKNSISFARALKSEAILIVKGCGLAPPETADTYNTAGGKTLRKKQIPTDGSTYVDHLDLSTANDDQATAWVVQVVGGII